MKRVLILYQSSTAACGVGTWIDALSATLHPQGWDVRVGLAWGRRFHDPSRVEVFRLGLQTLRMDGRSGTEESRIQAIERAIVATDPDVVLLTVLDSAFEAMRRVRYRGASCRLVAVNHGNLPILAASLLQNRDVIDQVVCVSRLSYQAIGGALEGFEPERVRHIPNAVDVPTLSRNKADHPMRIGYVGRLAEEKRAGDIEPFFRALHRRLPTVEMWVAGEGEHAPSMRLLAAEFPFSFRYFGELDRSVLERDFYPVLDLLVHFSAAEAWGFSIAEAMSYGVVPVTSKFLGLVSDGLVTEGETGLVFPVGDVPRAVELAVRLCSDTPLRERLSASAKTQIRDGFSLERFGERWAQTLNECLKLPALPVPARPSSLEVRGRFGLPGPQWERLRRLLRKRIPHASPGEEWPHFRCTDELILEQMREAFSASEGAHS
ncbi:glycosyltransferase family 4 protein [Thiocapsa roseopersicina]|uniref:Glycosyltransferase involved in cell wall bisynthesis n=1 Tax=Thiocapsa roseopersicina TaxID=1058 RepID=A0A1H2QBS7_THIRO|nr:glycosyltransferase family 4 protein [Thiocapsa roseopersicina]SDW04238.1 Glycosyltransferase involved in cell wall bisynthesis [Thiocapsa roseopersicina]